MDHPDFSNWSQEEKDEYANRKLNQMRIINEAIQKRYEEVQVDKIAAENRNSSVTNSTRKQEDVKQRSKAEIMKRNKPHYSREWDRGKADFPDWDDQDNKKIKNYRKSGFDNQVTYKSNRKEDYDDEKNYNNYDHNRNYKSYSNDHCVRSYYEENPYKQNNHRSHEACNSHRSPEKFKKYFPTHSKKHYPKNYSLTDSALWHCDRMNEHKNKQERLLKWVKSVQISNLQENNCINNENENDTSHEGKCETVSKCLKENDLCSLDLSSRKEANEISFLRPQKFDCDENNIIEEKLPQQKKQSGGKSYTKFDRWNDSHDSDDDLSDEAKPEINYNSKSEEHDYNEKEDKSTDANDPCNSNYNENYTPRIVDSSFKSQGLKSEVGSVNELSNSDKKEIEVIDLTKHSLKSQGHSSEVSRSGSELSNSDRKEMNSAREIEVVDLVSEGNGSENQEHCNSNRRCIECNSVKEYNIGSYVKKSFGNARPNTARKVSSHITGYHISSGSAERNRKKGTKSKRNPETYSLYNSNDSCKNDHITKQRKFDYVSHSFEVNCYTKKYVNYSSNYKKYIDKKLNVSDSRWSFKQDSYIKKGTKTKRNTETNSQSNSSDNYKNVHVTKQGKFYECQSDDSENKSKKNRGEKNENNNIDKKLHFKVSHSLKEDTYKKKDLKCRRNRDNYLQYNSSDKIDQLTKQRNFDNWQSAFSCNAVSNDKCVKNKRSNSDENISDFGDGWGTIGQPEDDDNDGIWSSGQPEDDNDGIWSSGQPEDDNDGIWSSGQPEDDNDGIWSSGQPEDDDNDGIWSSGQPEDVNDGIWSSADQSNIKWNINDDDDIRKQEEPVVFDTHCNVDRPEKNSAKNPTVSDDGEWSTIEEGEIRSDDDVEENKEHVN